MSMHEESDPGPAALPEPPIATSLDDLKQEIWAKTGHTVNEDDPVMMVYVMHGVILRDLERLLERHEKASAQLIQDAAETFTNDVLETVEKLRSDALDGVVRERIQQINLATSEAEKAVGELRSFRRTARAWALVTILATPICAASAVAVFFLIQ